jgi:D-galactarolactone cycloisomerase
VETWKSVHRSDSTVVRTPRGSSARRYPGSDRLTVGDSGSRDGLVGWRETLAPLRTAANAVEEVVGSCVVGRSPYDAETLTDDYHFGRGLVVQSATTAVDIVLCDLKGNAVGEPTVRLLGTASADRFIYGFDPTAVVPYASTMYVTNRGEDPAGPGESDDGEGLVAAKTKIGRGIDDDVH